jgi:hypothetical protein
MRCGSALHEEQDLIDASIDEVIMVMTMLLLGSHAAIDRHRVTGHK